MTHAAAAWIGTQVLALACCVAWTSSLPAQSPPTLSEELLRQWDLNRDGKIDAGEAEVARSRMRRARSEASNTVDPVTGRPRSDTGAGRATMPAAAAAAGAATPEDGGLILVPGTPDQPPAAGQAIAEPTPAPPPRPERVPLPGTRAPATASTIPSVSPPSSPLSSPPGGGRGRVGLPPPAAGRDLRGDELSGRARLLPDGGVALPPGQSAARRPPLAGQQSPSSRPGVIAGGVRPPQGSTLAGPQGLGPRPAPGTSQSLNAGRPSTGLPQSRAVPPGGIDPYGRGPFGGVAPPSAARPFAAAGTARGGMQSQPPAATPSRAGSRPQVAAPRPQAPATTVPRPPRVAPENYFGR